MNGNGLRRWRALWQRNVKANTAKIRRGGPMHGAESMVNASELRGRRQGSEAARARLSVDRYLCAFTHESPAFADYVVSELAGASLRAVPPACGVDLVALARHATAARRRYLRVNYVLVVLLAALIVLAPVLGLAAGKAGASVLLALLALLGAFFIVAVYEYQRRRVLRRLAGADTNARAAAAAWDRQTEDRLEQVMDSNVVVFSGGDAFVAWGTRPWHNWQISLDARNAATDSTGVRRTVLPFSPADLHEAVAIELGGVNLPDVDVHHRLFVAGHAASEVPGLVPDPMGRPSSILEPATVRLAIDQPWPDARTYLCVEKTSWGGELSVNLFMRAAMFGPNLVIEFHAYVLLPLRAELTATLDHAAISQLPMVGRSLAGAIRHTLPRLWAGPWVLGRELLRSARQSSYLAIQRASVRHGRSVDRGAGLSIRAAAATEDQQSVFTYGDAMRDLDILQHRTLGAIGTFLDGYGVDTADFAPIKTNIIAMNSLVVREGRDNVQQALTEVMSALQDVTTTAAAAAREQP
jgi:hypothetical protein